MQVMNVRVYVYHPILDDSTNITALVVWDALTEIEAGGVVDNYSVVIQDDGNNVFVSNQCTCNTPVHTYAPIHTYKCTSGTDLVMCVWDNISVHPPSHHVHWTCSIRCNKHSTCTMYIYTCKCTYIRTGCINT